MTEQTQDTATTLVFGWDASNPPGTYPETGEVGAFYIGGDTPHVWTKEQVDAIPDQWTYLLPIFVRSNPPTSSASAQARDDAYTTLGVLTALGIPEGNAVALDLETAVSPDYVSAFQSYMPNYVVVVYGSYPGVERNAAKHYWVADYNGETQLAPGSVGTQYVADVENDSYDLSVWDVSFVQSYMWQRSDVDPRPREGFYPQTATGTQSLTQVAAARGTTAQAIINRTRDALVDDAAKLAEFNGYLDDYMPKGLVYYTENP
jgi:hypothetical protein